MSGFFDRKRPGSTGMAMFLNAGDPPFGQIEDLVLSLTGQASIAWNSRCPSLTRSAMGR
jgi:hypothetical protein